MTTVIRPERIAELMKIEEQRFLDLQSRAAIVTEREQGGRPLFRVRVGPFDKMEDAERAKEKLDKAGNETALVKVQR